MIKGYCHKKRRFIADGKVVRYCCVRNENCPCQHLQLKKVETDRREANDGRGKHGQRKRRRRERRRLAALRNSSTR